MFNVKVGDSVNRILAGSMKMPLTVTGITKTQIMCGPYVFDIETGAEIDPELGWNKYQSGSFIERPG